MTLRSKKKPKATKKKRSTAKHAGVSRVVTLLDQIGPEFLEAGARRISATDVRRVVARAGDVRDVFRRHKDLTRLADQADRMLSLLADHATGQYVNVPIWSVAVMTFGLLYVLKPIDIIPDALPEIGRLDDALVVSHAVGLTRIDLQNYKVWRLAADIK